MYDNTTVGKEETTWYQFDSRVYKLVITVRQYTSFKSLEHTTNIKTKFNSKLKQQHLYRNNSHL